MNYRTINNGRKNSKFYEFDDGTVAVSSYETLIAVYRGGILYELPCANYSSTTARHYSDFLLRYDIPRYETQTVSHFNVELNSHHGFQESNEFGRYGELARNLCELAIGDVRFPRLTFPSAR